jgi:UDP-N-acetylmuramoyl-tripeptide--D-alanyl-D-alanine ligase
MAKAMGAQPQARCRSRAGLSIDTRTIAPGEAFFALKDVRDGHDFVEAALKPARACGRAATSAQFPNDAPLLVVPTCWRADRAGARAPARSRAIHRRHRLGRQDRHQGGARAALSSDGETHASAASYNNHWGVPLSLARCPRARATRARNGHEPRGEIAPLTRLVRPHVAIITTVEPVHLEFFPRSRPSPTPRRRFFRLEPGGPRSSTATIRISPLAEAGQGAASAHRLVRRERQRRRAALKFALQADSSTVQARILGADVTYKLGAPGRHVCSIRWPCWRRRRSPAPISRSRRWRCELKPPSGGRGAASRSTARRQRLLIDESYNANPASMRRRWRCSARRRSGRAAGASPCWARCWSSVRGRELHRGLADPSWTIRSISCSARPAVPGLWEALPSERRGGYAVTAAALEADVLGALRAGDAVMVKGSLGSKMGPSSRRSPASSVARRPRSGVRQG